MRVSVHRRLGIYQSRSNLYCPPVREHDQTANRRKLVRNRLAVRLIAAKTTVVLEILAVVLARIADVSESNGEADSQPHQNKRHGFHGSAHRRPPWQTTFRRYRSAVNLTHFAVGPLHRVLG